MSVLIISQLPPPVHGSSIMTASLIECIEASGERVALVERRFSRSVGEIGKFSVGKVKEAISLVLRLGWALRRDRSATVVFFVTNRSFSLLVDLVLSFFLRFHNGRVIGYVHTSGWAHLAQTSSALGWIARTMMGACDLVVALSASMERDVRTALKPGVPVKVIPNAVRDPGVNNHVRSEKASVVFLGNFIESKGIRDFVEVARSCWGFEASFTAAGSPISAQQLTQLVSDSPPNLTILPGVYGEAKETLLRTADILILPSTYEFEAQPLVVLEALSYGVPVIAYSTGGIPDIVDSSGGGLLVESGRIDLLTISLQSLLLDDSRLAEMRKLARCRFERFFSPASYAQNWGALL